MTHIVLDTKTKRPGETRNTSFDFTEALPSGVTVSSYASGYPKALLLPDETDTPTFISSSSISSPKALATITGGTDGQRYKIIYRVNFSNGEIPEGAALIRVEKP